MFIPQAPSVPQDRGVAEVPARFQPAVRHIQRLSTVERFQAACIFGSLARGDTTASSDIDVNVLADDESSCVNVNHPIIDGVKLDLTFWSWPRLLSRTEREIARGERIPIVAESLIVFDKTGDLTRLRTSAQHARPKPCTTADVHDIQFSVHHVNDKAERFLSDDPPGALLVMHTGLRELLNAHYRIQGRWRISDKRLLIDLREWDSRLANLVERFVSIPDVSMKFSVWTEIIEYVMQPLGGRRPIAEINCGCAACRRDLSLFAGA